MRPLLTGGVTERLYHLRRDLVGFRRVVAPLREALWPIQRGDIRFVGEAALTHLRDVYDLVVRATDSVDGLRDLAAGALEAHLSIISNRMNLVMKQATSWGAILVVATLIAGVYELRQPAVERHQTGLRLRPRPHRRLHGRPLPPVQAAGLAVT